MTTFEVLTLFPEAIDGFVGAGLLGRALERGLVAVHCTNFRDFTEDKHRTVDDTPFGGGPGMVIKAEPVVRAIEHVEAARGPMHRVLLTPSAPRFDHAAAVRLAELPRIGLLCGRYEGIDDRVREHWVHECLSLGDFVLGGGEVAALAMIEAISRLREGVLGNPESAQRDSFAPGPDGAWLEHPQYTRPADFRGHRVPEVLLSGDHGAIERWRRDAARRRTWAMRPDLRPRATLPADAPIYLWIGRWIGRAASGTDLDPDRWCALARHHGVAGVMLVGASDATLTAWVRAFAGRPPVAAVADIGAARKRLRRAAGTEPWVVVPSRGDAHAAGAVGGVAELVDALGPAAPRQPIAVWISTDPPPPSAQLAQFDLTAIHGHGLALVDTIADVSQPVPPPAALADALLARLRDPTHGETAVDDGGVP